MIAARRITPLASSARTGSAGRGRPGPAAAFRPPPGGLPSSPPASPRYRSGSVRPRGRRPAAPLREEADRSRQLRPAEPGRVRARRSADSCQSVIASRNPRAYTSQQLVGYGTRIGGLLINRDQAAEDRRDVIHPDAFLDGRHAHVHRDPPDDGNSAAGDFDPPILTLLLSRGGAGKT